MVRSVLVLLCSMLIPIQSVSAEEFAITRVNTDFANAWQALKEGVGEYQYKTAYLQRCDFALTQRNYKSDRYRILFFGQYEEMEYLSRKYPQIVPYLPLKVVVMEEGGSALLMNNPITMLISSVAPEDAHIIERWHTDLQAIFASIRRTYE